MKKENQPLIGLDYTKIDDRILPIVEFLESKLDSPDDWDSVMAQADATWNHSHVCIAMFYLGHRMGTNLQTSHGHEKM